MADLRRWVSDRPVVDLIAGVTAGVVLAAVDRTHLMAAADHDQRILIYATLLAAATQLLGLVAAALAVVKAVGDGPRITKVREVHGRTVTRTMSASLRGLGYAAMLAMACLLADTSEKKAGFLLCAMTYSAIFIGALRLGRAIWVTGLILSIDDADQTTRNRPPPNPIRRRDRTQDAAA